LRYCSSSDVLVSLLRRMVHLIRQRNISWSGLNAGELPDNKGTAVGINMSGNILLMHLDDGVSGSGQTISDTSGESHDGITTGNTDCTFSARMDDGCELDGNGDYITITEATDFDLSNFTYSVWFNPNDSVGTDTLLDIDNDEQLLGLTSKCHIHKILSCIHRNYE